jgi:hypothetical protein
VTIQYRSFKPIFVLLFLVTFLAGSFVVWAASKKAQGSAMSDAHADDSVWNEIR